MIVEDRKVRLIVSMGKPFLADGHAHAGGDTLPEGPGSGLDTRDPVVLGVARRLTVELAEAADVVEGNRGLAQNLIAAIDGLGPGEVEHSPEQHRGMAIRE